MVKYVRYIPYTEVQSYPGATVEKLTEYVENGIAVTAAYQYIIIHIGTNNIKSSTVEDMILAYKALLSSVWGYNPKADILLSAILPRPVDFLILGDKVKLFNTKISSLATETKCTFLKTYRPFLKFGRPIRELFAQRDGGLHLNQAGTFRLVAFFKKVLVHKRKY